MKFTCLSKGGGFHFPPCHMLNVCGFRVLFDCPLDLSALTIFSPVPADSCTIGDEESSNFAVHEPVVDMEAGVRKKQKVEKPLDANSLIYSEPWYKTVNNLHLWNASFIDVVLISSPMGMLGLPYITRIKDFSAKIYVTDAAARVGQLMMEDLVSMHMEHRQFYGTEESSVPQWMKSEELDLLPSALKKVALGKDGAELGGWMPLYSSCEGLHDEGSIFDSGHAMDFDYHALQGSDLILYSDFSTLLTSEDNEQSTFSDDNNNWEELAKSLCNNDESSEEREKLSFICSCAIDSVKSGGSVLIPIDRLGVSLLLLEQISMFLKSSDLKVPIYVISSVAEELLAYTNIIPEWLCKQRQEKLFSGESLFAHVELIKEKKIHVFPAVHSPKLLMDWQEPCVIFSPHWSLRLGPAVHLLRRWSGDPNSLLVLEDEADADIALLPFKPMSMKVLQCSFLSGIKLQKVQPLLKTLQPKLVLFPEDLRNHVRFSNINSFSVSHYFENETLHIPSLKGSPELKITTDLASQLNWRNLEQRKLNITRLKGELLIEQGKHRLLSRNEQASSSQNRPFLHWGSPHPEDLLAVLSKMGINGHVERGMRDAESDEACIVHVQDPNKALIEVRATGKKVKKYC
ncbi:hypothetical protein ACOSP7_018826 [Xanthoceras sorbifolium]